VSIQNGAILPGDLLTISDIPGVAMKAASPGSLLGIALEGWEGGNVTSVEVMVVADEISFPTESMPDAAALIETQALARGYGRVAAGATRVHIPVEGMSTSARIRTAPFGDAGRWWVGVDEAGGGFTIILEDIQTHDVIFGWRVDD
ncbi:MAG: hypothetical protein RL141_362, partial [Candidatus Parcubacteria bacterium]